MIVAGSAVWFVVSTLLIGEVPDTIIMAGSLVVALAFISAFVGTGERERIRAAGWSEIFAAGAAGVLAWYVAPLVVLSQRATDAPSGTETLFFTTAGAMLASLLAAAIARRERPTFLQTSGVLLATLGSAALLANWERPSSFSPFLKFPVQEVLILVAGFVLALGLIASRRSGRALGLRSSLWIGMASAAVVAVVVSLPAVPGAFATITTLWPQLLLTGVALSTLATGLVGFAWRRGVVRSTTWLILAPLALTGLSVVERLTGAFGPTPIVWPGAVGGSALMLVGLVVVQTSFRPGEGDDSPSAGPAGITPTQSRKPSLVLVLVTAGIATVTSVVALFLPAFTASVSGTTEAGAAFSATWAFAGAEAVAGWLPLCAALLCLAAALSVNSAVGVRAAMTGAVAALLAVATYPLVVSTPLHTWTRWIPAEIQQAYGTEYARLTLDVAPHVIRNIAIVSTVASSALLIVILVLLRSSGGASTEPALEENA